MTPEQTHVWAATYAAAWIACRVVIGMNEAPEHDQRDAYATRAANRAVRSYKAMCL